VRLSLILICGLMLLAPAMAWLWFDEPPSHAAGNAPTQASLPTSLPSTRGDGLDATEGLNADIGPSATPDTAGARTFAVVDLCGLGRLSVTDTDEDADVATLEGLPAPVGQTPLAQAKARWLGELREGGAGTSVAALLLDKPATNDDEAKRLWGEALLRAAYTSENAAALTWAEEACTYAADDGACRLSLVRARLRADPTNAVHWVALADEDPTAAEEAWRGLLAAKRWTESPQALESMTQAALPDDVPAYVRQALGEQVRARAATLPAPSESFVQERCQDPVPERKQQCDHLIRMLLERGDSLHTLSQAAQLAQASGWAPEQLNKMNQELQALASAEVLAAPDKRQPLSCASAEASSRFAADVRQLGELGALQARRAASTQGLR
jgi:hypothetical protein